MHHAAIVFVDCSRIREVNGMLAEDAACGCLLWDSSGFFIVSSESCEDIKRGIISRRRFVKLRVLAGARNSRIVSYRVTGRTVHDSLWFRQIFARMPDGTR